MSSALTIVVNNDKAFATPEQIARARKVYSKPTNDDIQIDDKARCNSGLCGVWVQAWVWVYNT